jgi:hypothetical protein
VRLLSLPTNASSTRPTFFSLKVKSRVKEDGLHGLSDKKDDEKVADAR